MMGLVVPQPLPSGSAGESPSNCQADPAISSWDNEGPEGIKQHGQVHTGGAGRLVPRALPLALVLALSHCRSARGVPPLGTPATRRWSHRGMSAREAKSPTGSRGNDKVGEATIHPTSSRPGTVLSMLCGFCFESL